ncbi:FimV/HubP family polar landmark protein [Kangiella sp. TOML190]|uniref:FimV/HubP family polar landmark protein n=1 Tax=Kangiella sp. TOML190 TaxID=2931351 RepID=UPI002041C489|nr:FimV/HubP family polar landmark protein [Kangiella sp. TOML190]
MGQNKMQQNNKFRRLMLPMAVATAMASPSLWGLGLGEISSKTKLNQPLSAEIRLLSSKEFEQTDLKAKIASYEAYSKFGVTKDPVHNKFVFDIIEQDDGSKFIKVMSKDAIREPYINFLVELTWPQGRLLREYTVLLDPPALDNQSSQLVTPSETQAPVSSATSSLDTASQTSPSSNSTARPKESSATTNTNQTRIAFTGDSYQVQRGNTLWSIARRVKPEGASVNQTLAALYRNNPSAFINNDIDRLKAGAVLKVPTASSAQAVSRAVSYQDLKSDTASAAPLDVRKEVSEKAEASSQPQAGSLTISSVTESDTSDTSGSDILDSAAGEGVSGSNQELVATIESLKLENEQLKQQLAAVNSGSEQGLAVEDETLSVLAGSATAKDDADEALETLSLETASNENSNQAQNLDSANTDTVGTAVGEASQPEAVKSSPKQASFWQKTSFWGWLGAALAALLALFGLTAFWKKRQQELEEELVDPSFSYKANSEHQPAFTDTPMDSPEVETDPVEEADILIAQGKLEEAESKLLQTLEQEPSNHGARIKLMEVYSSNQDAASIKKVYSDFTEDFDHDSRLGLKAASLLGLFAANDAVSPAEVQIKEVELPNESQVFGDETEANELDLSEELEAAVDEAVEEASNVAEEAQSEAAEKIEDNVIEFNAEKASEDSAEPDIETVLSEDEAETKMELAKAYLDMGDEESAREILEEIAKEGSEQQRQAAADFLAEL